MADTLLLDPDAWDLVLDNAGNIALASSKYPNDSTKGEAYGQAQDASCQIRLFQGELIYDTAQGIPYWEEILGQLPPTQLMTAKLEQAAMLVPGVIDAVAKITSVADRLVTGLVEITNKAGVTISAEF